MNKMLQLGILLKAKDMLSPKLSSVGSKLAKFDAKVKKIGTSMTKIGVGSLAIGAATLAPVKKFYSDYTDIAKKEGELQSLGIGAKGIQAITSEAKTFTNQFARISAPEFLNAAYDIKSGISSLSDVGVAKMTRFSSMTAQATKASGAEMSKLFALGYGIFGKDFKSDFSFGEKFSAAIATSVQAFRTDGADLSQGLSNLGASGTSKGISLEEQLAIIGVSKDAFNSASEAATGYRAFLDGAGKAQKELGLRFTTSNGQMLPMVTILKRIKNKYKDLSKVKVQDKIKKAFGSAEAVKTISALIDKTDKLDAAQSNLRRNMDKGISVTEKMARTMNKGYAVELMTNKVTNLTSSIGFHLNPMITKFTNKIGNMSIGASTWMEKNKDLASSITQVVAIGGTALIGFGALGIAVGATMLVLPGLSAVFTVVGGVIALAVAAIGVSAYAIYKYWSPIKSFFTNLWGGVKSAFKTGVTFIQDYLGWTPLGMIINNWNPLTTYFSKLWKKIAQGFSMGLAGLKEQWQKTIAFFSFDGIGKKIGQGFSLGADGLKTHLKKIGSVAFDWSRATTAESGYKKEKAASRRAIKKPINLANTKAKGSQSVTIQKIEINNPTSTVDVQKGVVAGLKTQAISLSDEEF